MKPLGHRRNRVDLCPPPRPSPSPSPRLLLPLSPADPSEREVNMAMVLAFEEFGHESLALVQEAEAKEEEK